MTKDIYLAGGCFWGVEKYVSLLAGVTDTETGYANGNTENPTYDDVCYRDTGHAETVKVTYDNKKVSLYNLLQRFFEAINPTSVNRQGPDVGIQYRSAIYYTDKTDLNEISKALKDLQERYFEPLAIIAEPLNQYFKAEDFHQKYLDKNPRGYCHIGPSLMAKAKLNLQKYEAVSKEQLKSKLSDIQYNVTQESATEPPFTNEYWDKYKAGIYVDITTGEPLFTSSDKFQSDCGWPSFSKPIHDSLLVEIPDMSLSMERIEVRSSTGGAHLGHLFDDGPKDSGGLRYCINSASLKFIPKEDMEKDGYGAYINLVE